jgi:hypothetical protein
MLLSANSLNRPQTGGDFWSDIDSFFKETKIISTVAAPVIGFAGEALGSFLGPAGSVAGGVVGGLVGDAVGKYAAQQGYGKRKAAARR